MNGGQFLTQGAINANAWQPVERELQSLDAVQQAMVLANGGSFSTPIAVATDTAPGEPIELNVQGSVAGGTGPGGQNVATPTGTYPYSHVVLLEMKSNLDSSHFWIGTGYVIGPNTILTASHNIYNAGLNDAYDEFYIYPGYSGSYPNPAGGNGPISTGWETHGWAVGNPDGTISPSDGEYDYAVINTSYTFNGWFGVIGNYGGGTVHMTGYPSSMGGVQDDRTGTVSVNSSYPGLLNYGSIYSEPGNSGGPLWIQQSDGPYAVGIVSSTAWANRITSATWNQIVSWVQEDGYTLPGANTGGGGGFDLTSSIISFNQGGTNGRTLTLTHRVTNIGSVAGITGTSAIYLSNDATISNSGDQLLQLGFLLFDPLAAGASADSSSMVIPIPDFIGAGTYWVGSYADHGGEIPEANDNNNASAGIQITISAPVAVAGSVSVGDVSISEGNSSTKLATFTVTRSGGTAAFAVNYSTSNGTASSGSDYSAVSSTLNFGANVNTQTVSVTIFGDTTIEPNETFFVNLSGATAGATIGDSQGLGTITNDDVSPFTEGPDNVTLSLPGGTWHALGGNDRVTGTSGADVIFGDAGLDTITGGGGSDALDGGENDDRIVAGTSDGNDTLTGGSGFDVLDFSAVGGVVQVNQFAGVVTGSAGNDTLLDVFEQVIGSNFGDVLAGGHGINVLDGNGGADRLYGNGGQDLLRAGDGDDKIFATTNDGNDTIEGGAGFDIIDYSMVGGVIQLNMFTSSTTGSAGQDNFTGIEYVIGSNFADVIAGDNGVNAFEGGAGTDQLFGNGGIDWINGGTGNDTITLGSGNDTFYFRDTDGVDQINDFVAGGTDDKIDLTQGNTSYKSFAAMLATAGAISQSGADTHLNLGGNDYIILKNVVSTNLTSADFQF